MMEQGDGSNNSVKKRRRGPAMYIALLASFAFIALGFIMPDIMKHFSDAKQPDNVQTHESLVYNIEYPTEVPIIGLDSLADFSLLDPDSGRFLVSGYTMDRDEVKQAIYSIFGSGVFKEMPDILPSSSFNDTPLVVVPEAYIAVSDAGSTLIYSEQSNRKMLQLTYGQTQKMQIFWRCFWLNADGKRQYAWIDDRTGALAAFRLDLSGLNYFRDDVELLHNIEETCIGLLTKYFQTYYDSAVTVFDTIFSVRQSGENIDLWPLEFMPAPHENEADNEPPLRKQISLCFEYDSFNCAKLYFNSLFSPDDVLINDETEFSEPSNSPE